MTDLTLALILRRVTDVWQHSGSFVIRFSRATDPCTRRVSGRAEHVATGKMIRFASMEELVKFMTKVLEEVRLNFEQADTLIEEILPPQDS
jgi:hypothetical protein